MSFQRILVSFFIVFAIAACSSAYAKTMEFTIDSDVVYIDNNGIEAKEMEHSPVIISDRTVVPVRIIAEAFGSDVSWNEETRTITITNEGKKIVLSIGDNKALCNGEEIFLDVTPAILNGRTMVPLRFISEALGMDVEYVAASRQILITDEEPVMTVNGKKIMLSDLKFLKTYYGVASDDELAEFYDYAINYLKSVSAFSHEAENNGIILDTNAMMGIEEEYDKDSVYKSALLASGIKIAQDEMLAINYLQMLASTLTATDKEIVDKYSNEYICAKHILLNTFDSETGESLSREEKEEAYKTAEDILKRIQNGEDYDKLMNEFSEDSGLTAYPNGYVFTKGDMIKEFEEEAFSLDVGQTSDIIESIYGYHIILREELPEIDAETRSNVESKIIEEKYYQKYDEVLDFSVVKKNLTDEAVIGLIK